jgi:hypothetical protein
VAEYQLVRSLPEPLDTSLPSIEEIEAELSRELPLAGDTVAVDDAATEAPQ